MDYRLWDLTLVQCYGRPLHWEAGQKTPRPARRKADTLNFDGCVGGALRVRRREIGLTGLPESGLSEFTAGRSSIANQSAICNHSRTMLEHIRPFSETHGRQQPCSQQAGQSPNPPSGNTRNFGGNLIVGPFGSLTSDKPSAGEPTPWRAAQSALVSLPTKDAGVCSERWGSNQRLPD
jgi:hypothetical protein